MVLTRVSFDLEKLLNTSKETQNAYIKRAKERSERGAPAPDSGAPGPQREQEGRDFAAARKQDEEDFQQEEEYVKGRRGAMDAYRVRDECDNPYCPQQGTRMEVDADGNATCPVCGSTKERVEGEMESGESRIVEQEAQRTFEDGKDLRQYENTLERQEKNQALYVIEQKDVPRATVDQRWWANNRMNQSMLWADLMGMDTDMEDGFVWNQRDRGPQCEAVAAASVHRRCDGPGVRLLSVVCRVLRSVLVPRWSYGRTQGVGATLFSRFDPSTPGTDGRTALAQHVFCLYLEHTVLPYHVH